jgi:DNA-binding NarL/FixJ family response regulator
MLTERQLEILSTYGRTGSAQKTADELFVSEKTVRNALSAIYSRLGVTNGVAAVWKVFVERPKLDD